MRKNKASLLQGTRIKVQKYVTKLHFFIFLDALTSLKEPKELKGGGRGKSGNAQKKTFFYYGGVLISGHTGDDAPVMMHQG